MLDEAIQQLLDQWEASGKTATPEALCGDRTELIGPLRDAIEKLARIEPLLSASGDSGSGSSQAEPAASAPTQVGPYHILRLIGRGGMGAVYLAEQRQPVRRQVAIKVIRPGFDSREVTARFEAERQALARMDHPGIARVLDVGTSETGFPYFVMEYVAGQPVTTFADERMLTITQRLELFVQVCDAIQHAHTKAVLHRDIKPGNVLAYEANERLRIKVIDFGIAKALADDGPSEQTFATVAGVAVGTYEYMSPEQASGASDVDTRADVYSLGVLLYELLVGAKPLDRTHFADASPAEIRQLISKLEPARPSRRLREMTDAESVATARQVSPTRLMRQLEGELEWIPLKAIRKDRGRRYASVADLTADVQNYLHNRPLLAGPETAAYRLRKWTGRNWGKVSLVLLLALVLAGGIAGYVRGIRSEQARTDQALKDAVAARQSTQAVNQYFINLLRRGDRSSVMREFPRVTPEMVRQARKQFADQPRVLAGVLNLLGLMQTGQFNGDSEPLLREASELTLKELGRDDPLTLAALMDYANALDKGTTQSADRDALRLKTWRDILEVHRRRSPPTDAGRLKAQLRVAEMLRVTDETEALLKEGLADLRTAGTNDKRSADARKMPVIYAELEGALIDYYMLKGRVSDADRCLDDLLEKFKLTDPYRCANTLRSAAWAVDRSDPNKAEKYLRQAMALFPAGGYGYLTEHLASLLREQGRFAEAEQVLREYLAADEKTLESANAVQPFGGERNTMRAALLVVLYDQHKDAEAINIGRRLYEEWKESGTWTDVKVNEAVLVYGSALQRSGDPAQAERVFRQIITRTAWTSGERTFSRPQADPYLVRAQYALASICLATDRAEEAAKLDQEADATVLYMNPKPIPPNPPVTPFAFPPVKEAIDAADLAALRSKVGQTVTLQGQVMDMYDDDGRNIVLNGPKLAGISLWIPEARHDEFSKAYGGIYKTLYGQGVIATGRLYLYAGNNGLYRDRLELRVGSPGDIQIIEKGGQVRPAATQPSN